MATLSIGKHTTEVPDEAVAAMEAQLGRFPQYHGNLGEWFADWMKDTLLGFANQEHTTAAQAALDQRKLELAVMFAKKPTA